MFSQVYVLGSYYPLSDLEAINCIHENEKQQAHILKQKKQSLQKHGALVFLSRVLIVNISLFQIQLLKIIKFILNILFTTCFMIYFHSIILMINPPSPRNFSRESSLFNSFKMEAFFVSVF